MKRLLYRALMSLFVPAGTAALAQTSALSVEEARAIVAPLYEALNEPAKKDVAKLLAKATSPEWLSCSGNGACVSREKVIARFQGSGDAVPDLKWEILEVLVTGDRVIVRGEASGGPIRPFLGVDPNGRRFKIMSIERAYDREGKDRPLVPRRGLGRRDSPTPRIVAMARDLYQEMKNKALVLEAFDARRTTSVTAPLF